MTERKKHHGWKKYQGPENIMQRAKERYYRDPESRRQNRKEKYQENPEQKRE